MKIIVTGSSGLVGSEAVSHFDRLGHHVIGVDNNMRADFFGPRGDTLWQLSRLKATCSPRFQHTTLDIRNREAVLNLFAEQRPDAVIHCAAQPSHDLAKDRPFDDFDVNANGTLNLLEANRRYSAGSPFVLMSTNKVYGDAPNDLPLKELETRWDYAAPEDFNGISESMRIDQSKHSLFGASKVAADVMCQEYGRYFDMPTVCFRGGCLTGPNHSGVELHGFLSYLVKVAVRNESYTIFGYKGKQVRDQLHSFDVVRAMQVFIERPRCGAVYNLGGGRGNAASVLESIKKLESLTGRPFNYQYSDQNRAGDHICYMSDLSSLKNDYPEWSVTRPLDQIVEEIFISETQKLKSA